MSTEPGLDRHEWESEWASLEEELEDAPAETLPLIDDLVARMLSGRGFAVDDPVADDGDEPEILAEFRAARDVTRRLDRDEDVGPGDVAAAVNGYRAIFEFLITERGAP
jgi:hypothetical protein